MFFYLLIFDKQPRQQKTKNDTSQLHLQSFSIDPFILEFLLFAMMVYSLPVFFVYNSLVKDSELISFGGPGQSSA